MRCGTAPAGSGGGCRSRAASTATPIASIARPATSARFARRPSDPRGGAAGVAGAADAPASSGGRSGAGWSGSVAGSVAGGSVRGGAVPGGANDHSSGRIVMVHEVWGRRTRRTIAEPAGVGAAHDACVRVRAKRRRPSLVLPA
jgi:hypothetical protein